MKMYKVFSILLLIGSIASMNAGYLDKAKSAVSSAGKSVSKTASSASSAAKSAANTATKYAPSASQVGDTMSAIGQAQMNPVGAAVGHSGY
jgi:uncharacterized protein (UPF0333 family)